MLSMCVYMRVFELIYIYIDPRKEGEHIDEMYIAHTSELRMLLVY